MSDGEPAAQATTSEQACGAPHSSGVFSYSQWVVGQVLTADERNHLAKLPTITIGSMCAGMGAEEIALTGIANALLPYNVGLKHQSIFKAEKDNLKMAFLRRHFPDTSTKFYRDNADV
jgi:hypothetical protein